MPNDDDGGLAAGVVVVAAGCSAANGVVVAAGGGAVNAEVGEVVAVVVGVKLNGFAPVAGAPVGAGNENVF